MTQEIPPLTEIVKMDRLAEVLDLTPSLSLPEILMLATKPLSANGRQQQETIEFRKVIEGRIEALEAIRYAILQDIIRGMGFSRYMDHAAVYNYLGKYRFLVSNRVLPPELEGRLDANTLKEIRAYREAIKSYMNWGSPRNAEELKSAEKIPVNLIYHHHQEFEGKEPHVMCCKTKAPSRMASKIPYYLLKGYRARYRGKVEEGTQFKRHIALDDGITMDNVGLQFVTLSQTRLGDIKRYIFQSDNIEVMVEKGGHQIEEYGTTGPYHALHMSVVWNPKQRPQQLFNPHADAVEVILMEFPYFMSANFGADSYWRRMMAQQVGIVGKTFSSGRREIDRFTKAELAWKREVERRIMEVLPVYKR